MNPKLPLTSITRQLKEVTNKITCHKTVRERMCVCVRERERECVCERERICVCERERMCV